MYIPHLPFFRGIFFLSLSSYNLRSIMDAAEVSMEADSLNGLTEEKPVETPSNIIRRSTPEGFVRHWKTWVVGRPLRTADAPHQTIGKSVGLAVFASDALSSTAYASWPPPGHSPLGMRSRFRLPLSPCWRL